MDVGRGRRTLFFGCLVTGHSSDVDLDFGADEATKGGRGGQAAAEKAGFANGFLALMRR